MHIERHVFGSYAGYTTLARSSGLSDEDARQLEGSSFAFGQTSDKGYLKGLKRSNAYFTRVLRGNRRGLTRVLEGQPDDNGRPTLLMVTAILSNQEWDGELCGDVELLLGDASVWRWDGGTANFPAVDAAYPPPSRAVPRRSQAKVLALLSELERCFASRRAVVVSADDFTFDELRALEVLVPPSARAQFTSAYGSLSVNLSVSVNCLASEADSKAVTFRSDSGDTFSPYPQFLLQSTSFGQGSWPLGDVMEYRNFGRRETLASAVAGRSTAGVVPIAMPPVTVIHRTPKLRLVLLLLLCATIAGSAGYLLGAWWAPQSRYSDRPPQMNLAAGGSNSERARTVDLNPSASQPTTTAAAPTHSMPATTQAATHANPPDDATSRRAEPEAALGAAKKAKEDMQKVKLQLEFARDDVRKLKQREEQRHIAQLSLARAVYELVVKLNSVDELMNLSGLLREIVLVFGDVERLGEKHDQVVWWSNHKGQVEQLRNVATDLNALREKFVKADQRQRDYVREKGESHQKAARRDVAVLATEIEALIARLPDKVDAIEKLDLQWRKKDQLDRAASLRRWLDRNPERESTTKASSSIERVRSAPLAQD